LLDANAVLKFLLQYNEKQFRHIKKIIRTENCYVTLEVLAEVCYVLEGLNQVLRENIILRQHQSKISYIARYATNF